MPPKTSSLQRRPRDATETSPASNVGGGQHLSLQQLSAIHESSRHVSKTILALSTMFVFMLSKQETRRKGWKRETCLD